MSKNFILVNHPVLKHKLSFMRDKKTGSHDFRELLREMSRLLAYEATRDLETKEDSVDTPLTKKAKVERIIAPPIIVSIMRAGNGMLDGILQTLPFCSAGHIGIYRDKFINNTVEYYFKIPEDSKGKLVLLADPILATGDTAIACIDRLKQYEVGKIKMLSILVSSEGLERLHHFHPDVEVYALSKEEEMNENGFLLPGIGDAGNRLYQTN
ncbi:MAG: uracil phosphoribosyltransferase [Bacteriovoracaceae bacterium]|nr:uracil phosphoribosyltransferase [Bacteriovoracaceae bacterium]